MKIFLLLILVAFSTAQQAGRRRQFGASPADDEEIANRRNIGHDYPYRRGETPIFNFDEGDEPFLDTIKPLVNGVYQMADLITKQRSVTNSFGEAFQSCEICH